MQGWSWFMHIFQMVIKRYVEQYDAVIEEGNSNQSKQHTFGIEKKQRKY